MDFNKVMDNINKEVQELTPKPLVGYDLRIQIKKNHIFKIESYSVDTWVILYKKYLLKTITQYNKDKNRNTLYSSCVMEIYPSYLDEPLIHIINFNKEAPLLIQKFLLANPTVIATELLQYDEDKQDYYYYLSYRATSIEKFKKYYLSIHKESLRQLRHQKTKRKF
jgi:hypothetical protein